MKVKINRYLGFLMIVIPTILFAQWIEHTIDGNFPYAYDVYSVDLNSDSTIDVLGASLSLTNGVIAWWRNGEVKYIIDTLDAAASVFAIDLDSDSDIDVLGCSAYGVIAWWRNNGGSVPSFTKYMVTNSFGDARSVLAIDIDSDTDIDVLCASFDGGIAWWKNDGDENFTKDTITEGMSTSVFAIDLDDDGDIDVLGTIFFGNISWWENDGDQNFTEHSITDDFAIPQDVFAIDLDNDGDIDVLGAASSGNISWWENDGDQNFTEHSITDDFAIPQDVFAIDLDNDGDIDVLGAAGSADDITWWENVDGIGTSWTEHMIDGNFDGASSVYAIDLNGDGDIDVLGSAENANDITWWEALADVHPVSIDISDTLPADTTFNPMATVKNPGAFEESFDVTCVIEPGAYTTTETVTALGSGDSIQVTFSDLFTFVPGTHTVTVYTQLANDVNTTNDTLVKEVDVIRRMDVGPISIDIPDTVPYDTIVFPQSTVKNFGLNTQTFNMTCTIDPGGYNSSIPAVYLPHGESIQVPFPDSFTFSPGGSYTVTISTRLDGDENPANDTLEKIIEVPVILDVGPISIDIPELVPQDTTINPQSTVKNFGTITETFPVRCTIEPGGYVKTQTVHDLEPGVSVQVTFSTQFTFESIGVYTVTVYTMHSGDENLVNDTLMLEVISFNEDVGVASIDIPLQVPEFSYLVPKATVKNYGISIIEAFDATCEINPGAYTSVFSVDTLLLPDDSVSITFEPSFALLQGTYTVKVYTTLSTDMNSLNDTLEKVIETYNPGVAEGNSDVPQSFSFGLKNNPAKGKALFNLALPNASLVALTIYDVSGRVIDKVLSEMKSAGYYEIPWTSETNAGVYFYSFESPWQNKVGKLVLVR